MFILFSKPKDREGEGMTMTLHMSTLPAVTVKLAMA